MVVRIESLTSGIAAAKAGELASLDSGLSNDYWGEENFVSDLPGKWDLSVLLLDDSDQIVGYSIASRADPCRAHLHRLVIAEDYRGRGLGTGLIEELRTRAQEKGLRRLSLKVGEENLAAKRLYSGMGFVLDDDSGPYHWMSEPLVDNLIVACHQPNFLPWGGYFAKLIQCDCFILLDDIQMPGGGSYVSRTKVADRTDSRWLTVPVSRKFGQQIRDVKLTQNQKWRSKHLSAIRQIYAKAPHIDELLDLLAEPYEVGLDRLSEFNIQLLERVLAFLGIRRMLVRSSTLQVDSTSDQRLIDLVQHVGGNTYLSGKGGKNYQNPAKFAAAGIDLKVMEYEQKPYQRGTGVFVPGLSIIDLIAWQGRDVTNFMRCVER